MSESIMYGYIYCTTCTVNGKKYIGQHRSNHFEGNDYLGSGILITRAINKYGADKFEVELLDTCYSQEDLNKKEYEWILKFDAVNSEQYYNLRSGGMQPGFSKSVSDHISNEMHGRIKMHNDAEEISIKPDQIDYYKSQGYVLGISENHRRKFDGENNSMYGRSHSKETKEKIRQINLERNPAKGKHWYTDGEHNILIFDTDPIPIGFKRGLTRPEVKDFTRKILRQKMTGRVFIHKGDRCIRVYKDQLNQYLTDGWTRGNSHNRFASSRKE